jgi:hypothetical protein
MDHEHIAAAHAGKRSDLVLAVLKAAFLVLAQDQIETLC